MARERRRIDTREKILEAAETQFARNGYAGAHLQSIAVEVGVQKTALYYYFPSKAALYIAVLSRMLESFERTATAAINRDESFRDRLGRLLDDLNDLLAERMNYSQILIRIYVDRTEDEIRVIDISLLPEFRNQGIGSALLQGVLGEAAESNRAVHLSVVEGNPARRLYQRLGFVQIGESGFYHSLEWRPQ